MACLSPIPATFGVLASFFLVPAVAIFAEETGPGPDVRMEIVSEVRAIRPGEPFSVGLHLEHGPGWHTYWSNPGIVGVPTSLEWILPEGFTAGPIQWPPPMVVPMAMVKAYGYEGEATLLVKITPPAELPEGEVELKAKVIFMACASTCHPGFVDLDLRLPVEGEGGRKPRWDSRWRKVFEATRASFPVPFEGWSCEVTREAERIVLVVTPDRDSEVPNRNVHEAYFFSSDNQVNSDQPQQVRRIEGGGLEFELVPSFYVPKDAKPLEGVLYAEEGWKAGGEAKAVLVEALFKSVAIAKP